MTSVPARRLLLAFAKEGIRTYFRPRPSERLQFPRHTLLDQAEEAELARRPYSYLYAGAAVELVVGTFAFLVMVGIGIAGSTLMTELVERFGNPAKWEGLIELFGGGVSFIALALLSIFALKLVRDLLTRALGI